MKTIQVVLDKKRAARRAKQIRSAFVQEALRLVENLDREGYSRQPQVDEQAWEAEAAWPE